jgi:hypothetical protein
MKVMLHDPDEELICRQIAAEWHDGSGTLLYAFSVKTSHWGLGIPTATCWDALLDEIAQTRDKKMVAGLKSRELPRIERLMKYVSRMGVQRRALETLNNALEHAVKVQVPIEVIQRVTEHFNARHKEARDRVQANS